MSLLSRPTAHTDAVVLRTWPCGETSVVASLLTRDHGFVKVLAKAARRARSRLRPLVEPGRVVHVEFTLDTRRELQYLRGGQVSLDVMGATADLERSAYLLGAVELVDRCRAGTDGAMVAAEGLFEVCEEFLRVLSSPSCRQPALLFFHLEWRLLQRHGVAPEVAACSCCGRSGDELVAAGLGFDPAEGGVVCGACAREGAGNGRRPLAAETWALLGDLDAATSADLAGRDLGPDRRRALGGLLHRFLGYHLPGYRLPAALELLRANGEKER